MQTAQLYAVLLLKDSFKGSEPRSQIARLSRNTATPDLVLIWCSQDISLSDGGRIAQCSSHDSAVSAKHWLKTCKPCTHATYRLDAATDAEHNRHP